VMNVIFGAIIGGFSLGQAAPNFSSFFTGRVAGGRIFRVINRVPDIDVKADGLVPPEGVTVLS
jgi:ATP-binding cassette, subfamily B (MDR/TAP), member 1